MADNDKASIDPIIDIKIGDRTFDLRPSFDALCRIERHLGVGLGQIAQIIHSRHYGAGMIARIVYEGIRAGQNENPPEIEELGDMIVRKGVDDTAVAAIDLIQAGLRGFERFNESKLEDQKAAAIEEGDGSNPT